LDTHANRVPTRVDRDQCFLYKILCLHRTSPNAAKLSREIRTQLPAKLFEQRSMGGGIAIKTGDHQSAEFGFARAYIH